jgi:hypothetical protein
VVRLSVGRVSGFIVSGTSAGQRQDNTSEGADMGAVPLISVIGPIEPDLLTAFVTHYRTPGVEEFQLGFHFPDDVERDRAEAL